MQRTQTAPQGAVFVSTFKTCSKCGEAKPRGEYFRASGAKDGLRTNCKVCQQAATAAWRVANKERVKRVARDNHQRNADHRKTLKRAWIAANRDHEKAANRRRNLRLVYGITPEQFDAMLEAQHGCCAVCNTDSPAGRGWHVDHDHQTGVIRGVLCHGCNAGIGNLKESAELLEKAADYVRAGGVHGKRS